LGVRRCGKSILSWQIFDGKDFGYINFFDERLAGMKAKDLDNVLKAFYELYSSDLDTFVFDEIQQVKGWERFVSRLRVRNKIVIPGSNSKLLAGELATFLTGRHIDFELFPFNLIEYLEIKDVSLGKNWIYSTKKISKVKKLLKNYLFEGGFPEIHKFGKRILQTIYSDIIEKDVIKRYGIRNEIALKELSRYLASNFSSEISYSKLKNIVSVRDVHTIKNWIEALKNAYLIFILERYSPKLKQQIIAPKEFIW